LCVLFLGGVLEAEGEGDFGEVLGGGHIVFQLALRRATEKNLNHHSRFCNHKIADS
jgi:hypothetical protein